MVCGLTRKIVNKEINRLNNFEYIELNMKKMSSNDSIAVSGA